MGGTLIRQMVGGWSLPTAMSSVLVRFRERYRARGPCKQMQEGEAVRLTSSSGFRLLSVAPALGVVFGYPPKVRQKSRNCYLWVINDDGIPFIREIPIAALNGEKPKHTNLTGGSPAYIGGELWFETDTRIFVSGCSGRYPPYGKAQLTDAVGVFAAYQYEVTSLGWSEDTDNPRRILE